VPPAEVITTSVPPDTEPVQLPFGGASAQFPSPEIRSPAVEVLSELTVKETEELLPPDEPEPEEPELLDELPPDWPVHFEEYTRN
jgi:hypothetical protein